MIEVPALYSCAPGNGELYQRQFFTEYLDCHVVHAAGEIHVRLLCVCHFAPHDVKSIVCFFVCGQAVGHELAYSLQFAWVKYK